MAIRLLSSESINGALTIGGALTGTSATFAGNVAIQSTIPKLSFTDLQQDDWDILNDNGEFKFLCSTGSGVALQLNTNNNATFAGTVTGTIARFDTLNNNANSANIIYRSGTDTIVGGGSPPNKIYIQDSGNVGIGTNSPECKLHIVSTTTDNSKTLLLQNSSTGDASVMFNISGDTYSLGIDNSDGDKFKLSYGALGTNDRLVVDSSGNVGIGLTIPTKKFEVNSGTVSDIVRFGNDSGGMVFGYSSNLASIDLIASQAFRIRQGSTTPLYIKSDGNVGIGSTSPIGKLQINGNGNSWNDAPSVRLWDTTNSKGWLVGNVNNYTAGDFYIRTFATVNANPTSASQEFTIKHATGNVGIGTTSPNYNLEIGGTANPVVAIVSNINSATSSLYFGDSDAKDRGQIRYTHFGDFMELKAGGATRVYIESGINTAYTSDGLFNSNATPSYWNHGNGQFKLGYMDNGSGLYSGAYAFNVKSTDGIPVTGREIGAIYINDTSNGRRPLIISNQGRITMDQTNTTNLNNNTGWLTIANGTSAYNFYNNYTGTDGGSGCARYRLNNTSPSFFDFYYTTTQVGYITTNGTDIFYANTSDYRLKEDLKSFDGMSLLEQIQVYDFKWKESDNRMYGVVAHELQEVVPQAVVGEKDEEKLQAVDYSKLVPVLIKSIQELEARVKELENN